MKNKRLWYQYSLRSLLVLVVLASVAMSWVAVCLKQKRAVQAVRESGGRAMYDCFDFDQHGPNASRPSDLQRFVAETLGRDLCARVVQIEATKDEALKELENLRDVSRVFIRGTNVSVAGLDCLKRSPRLEELFIENNAIDESGMESLAGLTRLRCLHIESNRVTDAALRHLGSVESLEWLWIDCSQVTDAGLQQLDALTRLVSLQLRQVRITGDGLKHLQRHEGLTRLLIEKTQINQGSMRHLARLTQLRYLEIRETNATDEDERNLKLALPACEVRVLER